MKSKIWMYLVAKICLIFLSGADTDLRCASAQDLARPQVLVIAGPCQHPPGTHEAAAGARLMAHLVNNAEGAESLSAAALNAWPENKQMLEAAKTIVFIGDRFPPERMEDPDAVKAQLGKLMDRGCGLVCIHYATGLQAQHVAEDGGHPLLHWLGGYFATGCKHHRSVARCCTATIVPGEAEHPVLRGWQPFTFDDEPYWNNYFGKDGPAENVTTLATSMLPADNPKKEIIAWAVERDDGGRGVGIVLPHYFRNWKIDDLRMFILNGIVWSAGAEVPTQGVESTLPDLATFGPEAVQPQPRPKRNR